MATAPKFRIDVDIHNLLLPRALRPRLHRLLQLPIYVGAGMQFSFQAPMALPNPSALTTHGLAQLELVQECFANGA